MEIQNTRIQSEGEESDLNNNPIRIDISSLEKGKNLTYKIFKCKSQSEATTTHLFELQVIIIQHLPQLPSEYIHRMITDRNHCNIAMILDGEVIGGSCFRLFRAQSLAEIVFFVIDQKQQNKGFGKRLMQILKDFLQNLHIQYVLTFADHLAINFFQKQGFTKNITLDKSIWKNLIKEYSGSSLVQLTIFQKMKHLIPDKIIESKKKQLNTKIMKVCLKKIRLKKNLKSIIKLRTGFLAPLPRIPIEVWLPKQYLGFEQYNDFSKAGDNKTKYKKISMLMLCKDLMYQILNRQETQNFQFDSYFYKKISDSDNPFKGVNFPTIWKKLQNKKYSDLDQFVNDLNSFLFLIEDKSEDEEKKKSAKKLREYISRKVENLRFFETVQSNHEISANQIQEE